MTEQPQSQPQPIEATCHCGAVRIEVPEAPQTVTSCNCSICRRTGVLWAYYPPSRVRFLEPSGKTDFYMWGDRELQLHRCAGCGVITHWSPVDPAGDRMGINARNFAPEVTAAARIRRIDGASTWKYLDE